MSHDEDGVDATTRLELSEILARELAGQIATALMAKDWTVHTRGAGMEPGPVTPTKPLLRAHRGHGKVVVAFRPGGEVAILVERVRIADENPGGSREDEPKQREETEWRTMISSTAPIFVVVANAELAAHDPDDLRLSRV